MGGLERRKRVDLAPPIARWSALLAASLLSGCGSLYPPNRDYGPTYAMDTSSVPEAVPRHEARSKYGNPASYVVHGKRYYVLKTSKGYVQRGIASWYGRKFHGRRTSSGEPYNMYAMTAAHKTLPLPTYARVTNLRNGRSVIVKINDRGPFHENRILDLSYAAASKLGIVKTGTGLVEVRALQPGAPTEQPSTVTAKAVPSPAPRFDHGPTPRPTPLPASAGAPSSQPKLFLQVGAFVSRENAERLRRRLQTKAEAPVHIDEVTNPPHATVYRVRLGPLADVAAADAATERLSGLGLPTPQVIIEQNWTGQLSASE